MIKFGSLFSGIGGIDLGLERAGMKCVWQVEVDEFCAKVLNKHWPDARKYKDVKEVHGIMAHTHSKRQESKLRKARNGGKETQASNPELSGRGPGRDSVFRADCPACLKSVDLIAGGFPCQPHSVAGKQEGAADDRNLWPEFIRIIREIKPKYVLAENVPGIITTYIDTVLSDLENAGYTCATFNLPAVAFDAPHRRERIFIVAYAISRGSQKRRAKRSGGNRKSSETEKAAPYFSSKVTQPGIVADAQRATSGGRTAIGESDGQERKRAEAERESLQSRHGQAYPGESQSGGEVVADAGSNRHDDSNRAAAIQDWQKIGIPIANGEYSHWKFEPDVGRVAHGVPSRVDRLKGLGNAVVPQVAEWIGRRIIEFDESS